MKVLTPPHPVPPTHPRREPVPSIPAEPNLRRLPHVPDVDVPGPPPTRLAVGAPDAQMSITTELSAIAGGREAGHAGGGRGQVDAMAPVSGLMAAALPGNPVPSTRRH